ncbi:hypothetical protein ZWY2020_007023 [Hordeum vulgare]|nr:hypothetical protein ZWY2020_007023 [Hordeum vulgare]
MLRRLRLRGHSSFFVLAHPAPSDSSSPIVLSRLSRGLLARATAASPAHDLLFARALLFTATPASPHPRCAHARRAPPGRPRRLRRRHGRDLQRCWKYALEAIIN